MPVPTIRHLASGGVITNYHCVSRCGHCLYNCGPHRPKDYLDDETAEAVFRRVRDLGCGIRGLHDLAEKGYGFRPERDGYLNPCDLCTEIRGYLLRRSGTDFPELSPPGFYA